MLNYITLMQVIGCILVIFGHSYPFVTDVPEWLISIRTFIYTFHMPLFVFCSGYLFKRTKQSEKSSFSRFVHKRARRILVPYIVLSLIAIVPKALASGLINDEFTISFESILRAILVPRENIWGHFWFLPMIFFMGVVVYALDAACRLHNRQLTIWGGILALSIGLYFLEFDEGVWLGLNDLLRYFWLYILGIIASFIEIKRISCRWKLGCGLIIVSVIAFVVNNKLMIMPSAVTDKCIAVAMVFGVLLVCISLNDKIVIPATIPLRQTYTMFILSWPCQLVCEIILERVLHCPVWLLIPCQFLTGIFITQAVIKLIDWFEIKTKMRLVSFCLGR